MVQHRPTFVEALNNLGSYYLNVGDNVKASDAYLKGLEVAPDSVMIRTNLTLALLKQQRYREAAEYAQGLTRIAPRFALGYFYLGQAYQGQGMGVEAETAYRKAKELNPKLNVPMR